jgi:4-hydroxy-2-oxoheptanedioate aldolase
MFTSHAFQTTDGNYISGADKNLLVIVQIESVKGVENVEEIAKVDGLDCLFIGTFPNPFRLVSLHLRATMTLDNRSVW